VNNKWYVYIVECADGSFYTGITIDLDRRLNEHNYSFKLGAKYTRSRRPVRLVYKEEKLDRSDASKREAQIKRYTRNKKLELVNSQKQQ